jgi:ABC-type transporter Mla MlaB component
MLAASQSAGTTASALLSFFRGSIKPEDVATLCQLPHYEINVIDDLAWNELCFTYGQLTREGTMLRITIHRHPGAVTLQLEGRLSGPWVHELAACWRTMLDQTTGPVIRVDLTAVTFVDNAGKELLTAMHRRGAKFDAADCLMNAVVAEVTGAPAHVCRSGGQTS